MYEPGSLITHESIDRGVVNEYGSRLLQITSGPTICTNIYSEICYAHASSRYIVYSRAAGRDCDTGGFWRYDFKTGENILFFSKGAVGKTVSSDQKYFWFAVWTQPDVLTVFRIDIETLEEKYYPVKCPHGWNPSGSNTPVTEDGRYMVLCGHPANEDRRFLVRLDMAVGVAEIIADCYGPELCNPHMLIDPSGSGDVLLQINRGVRRDQNGSMITRFEPYGPRMDIVNVYDKSVRQTKAGYPYTPTLGGHSCWIGKTGSFVSNGFVVDLEQYAQGGVISAIGYYADMERGEAKPDIVPNYYPAHLEMTQKTGSLCILDRIKNEPRLLGQGYYCGHPNSSRDGRFFCADVLGRDVLIIGSFKTGCSMELLCNIASMGGAMNTQVTPYFTPDNQWIIHTSDCTGIAQVCAVSVPGTLLEQLDKI